jgi:hypothetical protein
MRFLLFLLLPVFFVCLSVQSVLSFDDIKVVASGVDMGLGYRSDQLDWAISADSDSGTLSELRWDDLDIFQVQASGWLEVEKIPYLERNFLVVANVAFGKIFGGTARDSDFDRNSPGGEWSRSVSDADDGLTVDISGAVGPIFELKDLTAGLFVTPLIGYGFNMQALTMTNGRQVVSGLSAHSLGPFSGLDSTYTAYWHGPWVGTDVDYLIRPKMKVSIGVEYHWVDYFAQADWNLRTDFEHPVSFEHEASGSGVVWRLEGAYQLDEKWSLLLNGNIQNWHTDSGTDRTYFQDGYVGRSRLNQVNWDSYALTTGVEYLF